MLATSANAPAAAETIKTSQAAVGAPATTSYTSDIAGPVGGLMPSSVVAADVNGDGRPDLITANQLSHNVSVIARTSDGSGWEPSMIAGTTGPSPNSVAVADVTGDDQPDLITANANGSSVSVIARSPDGSGWEPMVIAGTTGFAPGSVVVEDVTGDGRPDLITANGGDDNLSVIARNATDTGWEISATIPTRDSPSALAVTDVTGDGQPDLVTTHPFSNDVSIIARTSDGSGWEPVTVAGTTGNYPDSLAVADVTGDGRPDLVTANYNSSDVSVIARTGDGTGWQATSTIAAPAASNPLAVAATDVTGDGRPDLITANAGSFDVSVIVRNTDGSGWEPATIAGATGSYPSSLAVADVTDDDRPDLITANATSDDVSVLTAQYDDLTPPTTVDDVPATYRTAAVPVTLRATDEPGGSGVSTTVFTTGVLPTQPTVLSPVYDPADKPILADGERISYFSVDEVGNTEAVQTSRAVTVAPATTHYTSAIAGSTGSLARSVAVADVTGDGRPDLVTALQDDKVSVIARNGTGTGWATSTTVGTTGNGSYWLAVGDVTGDGRPDLVTANAVSNDVSVIARNGTGTGWEAATIAGTTGSNPSSVAVGDVTGDGRPDLVTANRFSNDVSVIARNGTGTGWEASTIAGTTGSEPASVAVGDVTGDGRPDLVTANNSSNDVSVIARNSTGFGWLTSTIAGTTDEDPNSVVIADVTGDGRPDLVTANSGSANVSVVARNGTGTGWLTSTIAGTTANVPASVAVADMNGDGRPDLVTSNAYGDNVSVITRNSTGDDWDASTIAGTTGTNPYSVAVGDVTGDGRPDIVTANLFGGSVSVLTAHHDGSPPTTTDDVPATHQPAPVRVTLTASDGPGDPSSSGVRDTYYTVGTSPGTPTTDSEKYAAANKPTLNDGEKIAYFSVDRLGNAEAVKTSSAAKIDQTAPTTADDIDPGWHDAPVRVTLSAADTGSGVEETYYSVGASPQTPTTDSARYDAAAKPTLNDGEKIAYFSVDRVGNRETVKTSGAAKVDQAAPTTTDDVDGSWHDAPVPVTLAATDTKSGIADTYYTVGTSPATPTTDSAKYAPASKPTLNHGEKIAYLSVDEAGNTEAVRISSAAKVDQTAPTTTDDVDAAWHDAPVAVTLTATDTKSGVAETYYSVGASPATPTTASPVYDPGHKPTLNHGEKISYFSVDRLGNAETVRTSGAAKVDATIPETTITAGPARLGFDRRPSIAFSSSAPDATFECAMNDDAFTACVSPFRSASGLADGQHRFRVRAVSRAGVIDASAAEVVFVVDTTPTTKPPPSPEPTPPADPSPTRVSLTTRSTPTRAPTALVGRRTALDCTADRGPLRSCTVEARSVKALKTTAGKRVPAGTVLARGTSTGASSSSVPVDVQLTAAARSVAARYPLGIDAQVLTSATTTTGTTLNASSRLAVLGNATVVLPVRSASATKLSAVSKRALAQLARAIGEATTVRCAAYTDNSLSAPAARKLTTGQAQAACRYLQQRGLKAATTIKGFGSKRPRASNATAKGRAKNRRLEITVAS